MIDVQEAGLERHVTREGSSRWTVRAKREITYDVIVSRQLFSVGNPTLATMGDVPAALPGSRRFVVIDAAIDKLYGVEIRRYFQYHDVTPIYHVLEAHEVVKNWKSVETVINAMATAGIDRRREPVIGIGGGTLLDIVGFAASIYRRNTPYIRIPTALIGIVDAGIGIKTGVNFGLGKNRIGTYAAPVVSYLDQSFLCTLDRRHVANGIAEILKMALIRSADLMSLLERHGKAVLNADLGRTDQTLTVETNKIITMAVQLMLKELQPNLWEANLERCVDYGHTFSPMIEMRALPELLHGEAVNIDMALSSVISFNRGLMSRLDLDRIFNVMRGFELPTWNSLLEKPKVLNEALTDTLRHRGGKQRIPLPVGIGEYTFINDLTEDELASSVAQLKVISNTSESESTGLRPWQKTQG